MMILLLEENLEKIFKFIKISKKISIFISQ